MVASKAPDWLPSGWTVQVKVHNYGRKVMQYCNVETGQKFYSKKDVIHYIEQGKVSTPQLSSKLNKTRSKNTTPIVVKTNENPEWLPHGWITELKTQNSGSGKQYKCYIDPASGCKFYSKPEVSRYLETVNMGTVGQKKIGTGSVIERDVDGVTGGKSSLKPDTSQNYKTTRSKSSLSKQEKIGIGIGKPSIDNVVTERDTPDELPLGWIKEIKTTKSMNGIRKYPYYTDPVSGYVFSSKKDALRYVETGDIGSCVVKPKKRDMNDQELKSGNIPHNSDRSTKGKSSSKPDESPNGKAIKSKSCIKKQEKVVLGEPSTDNVVIERDSSDELPPGWIKEIKTKKSGNGVRKYMLYTDPLSGYVFSSKKDALRYLETGDIDSCAVKPKKRDTDDPELINGKISVIIHSLTGGESFSKPDTPQNCNTRKSKSGTSKQEKVDPTRPSIDKVVNESGSADELPPGWIKEIKVKKSVNGIRKYPYYVDPSSGYVFSSKKDALRYVETGDIDKCAIKPKKREMNNPELINANISIDEQADEVPEWLPSGWTMELKTKNSHPPTKYKCYIETGSGRKFYSKPGVSRYLETVDSGTVGQKNKGIGSISNDHSTGGKCSSMPDTSQNCKPVKSKSCTSEKKEVGVDKHMTNNVAVERGTTDELPPGWIKEIRSKKLMNGIRKDPYYTDPVSGYVFRSLKDALRYLESGDISKCAIKPRKRDMNDLELVNGNISSPSTVEAKKSSYHTTRRQIFAGTKSSASGIHEEKHLPDDANASSSVTKENSGSKSKGSKRKRGMEISAENTSVSTLATTKGSKRTRSMKVSSENTPISTPATSQVSKRKRGMKVSTENGSVSTPPTDIVQEEKLQENVIVKTHNRKAQVDSSKPKKKRALPMSPPGRTSKRLAGVKPEMPTNFGSSEVGTNAAPQGATQVLEGEPEREIAPHASISKEITLNMELPNQSERPLEEQAAIEEQTEMRIEDQTVTDEQTEKPPEGQAVTEEQQEKPLENQAVIEEQQEKLLENQAVTEKLLENQAVTEKPQENQAVTEKPQEDQAVAEEQQEKPLEEKAVVAEEQPGRQEEAANQNDETPPPELQNPQVFYPMMDSWSDPCIEFAFKTLTGAIPVEDNVGLEGYFQQQVEPSHAHNDDGVASFPVPGLPNYFQNDVSSNLDAPEKPFPGPTQQCPENPTYMPSCSNDGPQQSSTLEAGKQRM